LKEFIVNTESHKPSEPSEREPSKKGDHASERTSKKGKEHHSKEEEEGGERRRSERKKRHHSKREKRHRHKKGRTLQSHTKRSFGIPDVVFEEITAPAHIHTFADLPVADSINTIYSTYEKIRKLFVSCEFGTTWYCQFHTNL
jgi:hypothetical protein